MWLHTEAMILISFRLCLLEKHPGGFRENFYHSHLGEIDQTLLGEVWRALLDERQVSEVHAQVRNTRRVTAKGAERE